VFRAKNDLEKAVSDMAEGRYRDAVSACRDALEAAYGAADKDLHPELRYKVENLRDADKETRFWLVRRALWALTHAAKHRDDATQDIEWERRDAAAVVTMLAALLEQDPPL
jgi:predicted transcriptional regulator